MFFNELGVPPHEGLPGIPAAPLIDGFVEPEPGISMPNNFIEAGYVNSGRFVYGGGSGIPVAVIDCVRDNTQSLLYLGIGTRNNVKFNDFDFVMIVLRPGGPASGAANDLRIDIMPVKAAADGATPAAPSQIGDSLIPDVRGNRAPAFQPVFYERDTSAGTHPIWKSRVAGAPNNFAVKVRSTKTGAAPTESRCWSVELQIPTDGGGNWVALQPNFGLYLSVGRAFNVVAGPQSNGYVDQTPWPYDPANAEANVVEDPHHPLDVEVENWDVPAAGASSGFGTGMLVTSQAANPAKGVKFLGQEAGIGVLSGTTITTALNTTVNATNTLVARLVNTAAAQARDIRATFRVGNFGVGGPFPFGANWKKVMALPHPNPQPNPTPPKTLAAVASPVVPEDITLTWKISQQDHDDLRSWDHTCMWVELDSIAPSGAGVSIVQSSVRRNIVYTGMSEVDHKATIDGRGFGPSRQGNGKHDIILHVSTIPIPRPKFDSHRDVTLAERFHAETYAPLLAGGHVTLTPGSKETVGWISVVNSYVVTDKVLTLNGRKHKVVVSGGSYSFVAEHALEPGETATNVDMTHALEGPGLQNHGASLYQLSVPENGSVTLNNRLATIRTDASGCANPLNWIKQLFKKLLGW